MNLYVHHHVIAHKTKKIEKESKRNSQNFIKSTLNK